MLGHRLGFAGPSRSVFDVAAADAVPITFLEHLGVPDVAAPVADLVALVKLCLYDDPEMRPTAEYVHAQLLAIEQSVLRLVPVSVCALLWLAYHKAKLYSKPGFVTGSTLNRGVGQLYLLRAAFV